MPGDIRKTLRDVAIQLVRNAVVHGIEDAGTRRGLDKSETGLLQLQFKSGEQKLELVFQDDGCGIVPERLREAAVRRGDLSAGEAEQLDTKASLALIFKPGFSTHDGSGRDAGRGVGLDFVLKAVTCDRRQDQHRDRARQVHPVLHRTARAPRRAGRRRVT